MDVQSERSFLILPVTSTLVLPIYVLIIPTLGCPWTPTWAPIHCFRFLFARFYSPSSLSIPLIALVIHPVPPLS